MGLGLFLVRLVAQQSGGTFTIDSTRGVGTTCTCWNFPDVAGRELRAQAIAVNLMSTQAPQNSNRPAEVISARR